MTKVWKAEPYDINTDLQGITWGTREYLKAAGLEPEEGTERDVPDSEVDDNGKHVPNA